jgi:predicted nucleic acid-binding protein
MGMKYVWDTNIAIYYLQQQFPPLAEKFVDTIIKDNQPVISVITEIELLSWKTTVEKDIIVVKNFLFDSAIVELNSEIKFQTASLRKALSIKLPDAIIAASALMLDATLLTRNVQDFKRCPNLKVLNPFDL